MMIRRKPAPAGFTLLEVLVALAIFVAATAILSRLVMIGVENAQFAHWQAQALALAESHMARLEAGEVTVDDSGTVTPEGFPDWQVTMAAEPAPIDYLYDVTIEVRNVSSGPASGFTQSFSRLYFDEASVPTEEEPQ